MAEFHGTSLPPELQELEERLREHRYEASALELDRLKQQARARASRSTSLPSMRQESGMLRRLKGGFITAMLILGLMIGGTGAMLAVTGISPFTNGDESQGDENGLAKNAAHSQYHVDDDDDDGGRDDDDDDGRKDEGLEGSAFIHGLRPPGCSANPFMAVVTGNHIARVDFFIGNWRVGSAIHPDPAGRFGVRVDPRRLRLRRGPHILTAWVTYANGAKIPWTRVALGFCR